MVIQCLKLRRPRCHNSGGNHVESPIAQSLLRRPHCFDHHKLDHLCQRHSYESAPVSSFLPPLFINSHLVAQKSGRILLEAAPLHLNLEKVQEDLLAVRESHPFISLIIKKRLQLPDVLAIHDFHLWHLSQS